MNKLEENKENFVEEILKHKQLLYRIALTRLQNEEDINEVIQETVIAAYNNLEQLKDINKLKQWIIKILINKCNATYRKRKYKIISLHEIENVIEKSSNTDSDLKIDLEYAISKLKYKEKVIVILRYYEMYSIKEIASILNMNENTVKTNIKRSLEKIKKYYER